jgi:hypothetical protein
MSEKYILLDAMGTTGENMLFCSCGERLWPDCDVSSRSIREEFERHCNDAHGDSSSDPSADT